MTSARHVFTYGSLMFDAVWTQVVTGHYRSCEASLADFSRSAIKGETYPAIVRAPGQRVVGRLWLAVAAADLDRLDRFEGIEYRRESVTVLATAQSQETPTLMDADCYVWLEADRLLAHDWDPSQFERDHLPGFARRHGAGERCA